MEENSSRGLESFYPKELCGIRLFSEQPKNSEVAGKLGFLIISLILIVKDDLRFDGLREKVCGKMFGFLRCTFLMCLYATVLISRINK